MDKKKVRKIIKLTLYIIFSPVILPGFIIFFTLYGVYDLLRSIYEDFIEDL